MNNETPEEEILPRNPPSIITLEGVPPVRDRKISLSDSSEERLGRIRITRQTLLRLSQYGIDAGPAGISKVTAGAILCSFEGIAEVQEKILAVLENCEDVESVSALTNAYASLIKSQASVIKAGGASTIKDEKVRTPRQSYPKGEKIGPAIEILPKAG